MVSEEEGVDKHALEVISKLNPAQVKLFLQNTKEGNYIAKQLSEMVDNMVHGVVSDHDYYTLNQIIDLLPPNDFLLAKDLFGALTATVTEADKFAAIDPMRRKAFIGKIIEYIDGLKPEDYQKVINGESIIRYLEQEIAGEKLVAGNAESPLKARTIQSEIREMLVQKLLQQVKSRGVLIETVSKLETELSELKPDVAKRLYDLMQASNVDLSFWTETVTTSNGKSDALCLVLFDHLTGIDKRRFLDNQLVEIFTVGNNEVVLIDYLSGQGDYDLTVRLIARDGYLKTPEQRAGAQRYLKAIPLELAEDILTNAQALKANLGLTTNKEFLHYTDAYAEKMIQRLGKDPELSGILYVVNSLPSVLARRVVMKILRDENTDDYLKRNFVNNLNGLKLADCTGGERKKILSYIKPK